MGCKLMGKKESNDIWKITTIILAVLLIAAIIAIFVPKTNLPSSGGSITIPEDVKQKNILLSDDDSVKGDKNAPITIIEFSDFQCPFCGKFYRETLPSIENDYIKTGKVKLVFRDFPLGFHQYAQKASEAAECAKEQNKFWEMHNKLFENQQALTIEDLRKYAADLGLNLQQYNNCLDTNKFAAEVQKDLADGEANGISGTPAFLINGQLLSGALPYSEFKAVIESILTGKSVTPSSQQDDAQQPPQLADTSKDPSINLIIINDKNCAACDTSQVMQVTKTLFPTAKEKTVEFDSDEGKKLIKDLNINTLPAYIFDENVAKAANFEKVSNAMDKSGVYYVINPAAVGIGKLLNPPSADDDPVKGEKTAKLTIIEFSDFQCPFCAKFYNDAYKQIDTEYIKTGKVKLVFRDFPLGFHENAHKAAEAAECADEQGKFWEMHDKIFENQQAITISDLKKYAGELNLDKQKFDNCLDTDKYKAEVDKDMEDGSKAGVSGTPSFFINGQSISGAMPFEEFKKIIDAELAK